MHMRIFHVETYNEVAHTYALGLARRGHTSIFYEPSLAGGGKSLPIKLANIPGRVLDLRHAIAQMSERHCDVAHIHWASYGALDLVSRVPVVIHCHGSDIRSRAQSPSFRGMLGPVFRRAGAVLCITPDILEPARTLRPDALFVPGPVDTDHLVPNQQADEHPWTVLLFAGLLPIKGVATSTEALHRFASRHSDVRVILLDRGPLSQEYQQKYGKQFDFVPQVSQDAVRELIWKADVVVGQMVLGALGLSELQAMSCAKPVIASYRYPEAYPTPPPICTAETVDEIDAHLEALYHDREAAQALGRQAREWVVTNHHVDRLAERLEKIYASALTS
jgi:glycosyltransferase involved in cell wall biosynthesis